MKNGHVCRIDPTNPRIVYATLWEGYRNGHSMSSGGKDLECINRSVILGKQRNQECQLESRKNGNRCVSVNSNRLLLIENTKGGLSI
jgi:hypothetical protein